MNYESRIPFLPSGVDGYCALTCCMGVMNYFWNTSFCRQNNREMMKIMKGGKYTGGEMLDLPEIAYRLEKLGFNISYYSSMDECKYLSYLDNPKDHILSIIDRKYHKFIQDGFFTIPKYEFSIDLSDVHFEKAIVENQNINKYYSCNIEDIKQEQGTDSLFIVGVSYHVLHGEVCEEGENGGHVIIVSEITDNEVIIHDPGVPTLRYFPISYDLFLQAVIDAGEYSFIQVQYHNDNL